MWFCRTNILFLCHTVWRQGPDWKWVNWEEIDELLGFVVKPLLKDNTGSPFRLYPIKQPVWQQHLLLKYKRPAIPPKWQNVSHSPRNVTFICVTQGCSQEFVSELFHNQPQYDWHFIVMLDNNNVVVATVAYTAQCKCCYFNVHMMLTMLLSSLQRKRCDENKTYKNWANRCGQL